MSAPAVSELGPRPTLAWIDKAVLTVDASYQRTIAGKRSQALIAKLAENFSWAHCAPLIAATGDDGVYLLIDGQHRHAAALRRDDIRDLPCYVLGAVDRKAQVAAFIAHNRDRVALNSVALFHAAVGAGEAAAAGVIAACKRAGVSIPPTPMTVGKMAPNTTIATGVCTRIVEEQGEDALVDVLNIIREAHPETPGQLRGHTIAALATMRRLNLATRAELVEAVGSVTGFKLEDMARALRSEGVSIADAFVAVIGAIAGRDKASMLRVIARDQKERSAAKMRAYNTAAKAKKANQPFRFDRSKPVKAKQKPAEFRGDVKVRKFEAGDFYSLVSRALEAAKVPFEMSMSHPPQFKMRGAKVGLEVLVETANKQRAKEGKEPLPLPKNGGIARPGRRPARSAA